ncbi:MAG TPA: ATP-binding domain-containing protein, partial [Syntrophorhabdaceae bacterium]|nr:ATP-binding domain-containing protein [Syntrophorhabdaceae bacterium]
EILNPPPSSPAPQQAEESGEKEAEETGEEKKEKGRNGNETEDGPFMRVMDKVVHTKNMDLRAYEPEVVRKYGFDRLTDSMGTERRIYNGMIGIVANVDPDTEAVYVNFPADEVYVKYDKLDARYFLQHAYALTIHKVQGSEFNVVVIPVIQAHYNMLNSKLLYTAVTRAKEKAIFVGETYAFNGACKRKNDVIRNTVMRKILSGEAQQEEQDTFFGNMPAYGGGAAHV